MIRLLLFIALLNSLPAFSQHFIGKSKTHVKKELGKKRDKNNTLTIILADNDSVLVYSYKDASLQPVDFIYGFDARGNCNMEKVKAGCDSCFRKYLQQVLQQKKFGWRKVNENQYVSNFPDRLLLEIPPENKDFSYTILRTEWTREVYNMLLAN